MVRDRLPDRVFVDREARRDAVVRLLALLVVLLGGAVAVRVYAPFLADPRWVRGAVADLGPYGPVAFVALQTVQVVVAPVPGQTLGVAGGYLFGTVAGTLYSMVGVVVGSTAVFVLARRLGRPYVERVVSEDVLDRFDTFAEEHGRVGLFVVFLLPTFPDDAVCALAGLTSLRLRTLAALVAVGRLPTFALAAFAGDGAAEGRLAVAGGALLAAVVASVAVYLARDRFGAWRGVGE
jgi:uncharacterized membrane protein YdjX (TVP38/TMEM64 family)